MFGLSLKVMQCHWKLLSRKGAVCRARGRGREEGPLQQSHNLRSELTRGWAGVGSEKENRDSLVVQWLRIHTAMQGTWFQSLVREGTKTPRAMEQQNPLAAATEAHALWSPQGTTREPECTTKTWCSQIHIFLKISKCKNQMKDRRDKYTYIHNGVLVHHKRMNCHLQQHEWT